MCKFYFMIGFPGSGKSTYAEEFSDAKIIVHDQLVKEMHQKYGQNKARRESHKIICETLENLQDPIVIYDSVNMNSEGRKLFLSLVPKKYEITIVYFEHSNMIPSKIPEYVDILHKLRPSHICFPESRERAIETIENIYKSFDELTQYEKDNYQIEIKQSYIQM